MLCYSVDTKQPEAISTSAYYFKVSMWILSVGTTPSTFSQEDRQQTVYEGISNHIHAATASSAVTQFMCHIKTTCLVICTQNVHDGNAYFRSQETVLFGGLKGIASLWKTVSSPFHFLILFHIY